jgi:WD40 repeat protein
VWDAQTGQEERTLKSHDDAVSAVAFSPDGRLLAGACGDQVMVWEVGPPAGR